MYFLSSVFPTNLSADYHYRSSKEAAHPCQVQGNEKGIPQHPTLPHPMRLHPALASVLVLGTAGQSSQIAIIWDQQAVFACTHLFVSKGFKAKLRKETK